MQSRSKLLIEHAGSYLLARSHIDYTSLDSSRQE